MVATTAPDIVRTADGVPLKQKLQRVERSRQLKAVGLVMPLLLFIILSFALPILTMLKNAIDDPEDISQVLPATMQALQSWNGQDIPDEAAFAALAADLKQAQKDKTAALVGKRLNYEISGIRSKVIASARKAEKLEAGPYKDAIIAMDPVWGERDTWATIKRADSPWTSFYLLAALDMQRDADNSLESVPAERSIYKTVFVRTFWIAFQVTLATLILGFPVAYLLAKLPTRYSNLLMIFVLLPFWTSLLVRTTAWFVLLQDNGLINEMIQLLHLSSEPVRLIFSRLGTIIAMTHIQLPFTLLPIYSVMKTISPSHVRAARSLGAGPFYAFWRVYFPQTVPGIAAGCLLTFILCLGYYITPALVGGATDQMVSNLVATAINQENNWGKASALGGILLAATLILYSVYNRLVGVDKMKFG
ncbi:polyamine ABC transporter substrate-binding protein [Hypericibacter adhaerens]|jgi:putative spermidine/putrescine transport system permease protein|uniref:Polyamine ABC transporter substrate-binding protein n=1 Tax=Hypericibacter adhaerens TaxID=2602016 RepID=A0A5J6N5I9_9PROT|nr:ABC transporter permease [Hypericibacter adhaerens]QEX23820.1 polyamine ABC transporter substrate-binding protein [Hypericibacter adhaerens]